MSNDNRTKRILGGALVGVLLLGAGIGIGAGIWSGGSTTTRTVAAAPASNDAPDPGAGGAQDSAGPPGEDRGAWPRVHFRGLGPDGAEFSSRHSQPSACTKDATSGSWHVDDSGPKVLFVAAIFDERSCRPGTNHEVTWDADLVGEQITGQLNMKIVRVQGPGSKVTVIKVPECRGWNEEVSCSAGKATSLDPEFTLTWHPTG